MNKVVICGRLCRDNELRYSQSNENMAILRNCVAVSRPKKKNEEETKSDFINILAFYKNAEFIDRYFTKGQKIIVSGRLQVSDYQDKDGNKKTITEVLVEETDFASSSNNEKSETNTNTSNNNYVPSDDCDDDLPF